MEKNYGLVPADAPWGLGKGVRYKASGNRGNTRLRQAEFTNHNWGGTVPMADADAHKLYGRARPGRFLYPRLASLKSKATPPPSYENADRLHGWPRTAEHRDDSSQSILRSGSALRTDGKRPVRQVADVRRYTSRDAD